MNKRVEYLATTALIAIMTTQGVQAQDAPTEPIPEETVEPAIVGDEIMVLGTRRAGRTIEDSPVAVDLFSAEEINSVGVTDLNDVLQTFVPSFTVNRQPISDGATFIRPPQLRGLDSDKTLVLVNGKRRHRAALVLLGGFGSHGPDLATIPSISLKNVQVLRDGAGSQYGSDAIAGVLNFELKDADEGGSAYVRYGEFYEGDGENITVAANYGFSLFDRGFVNMSAEFNRAQPTSRGGRYDIPIGSSGLTPIESAAVAVDTNGDGVADRFGPDALTYVDVNGDGLPDTVLRSSDGIPDDTDQRFAINLANPEQVWGQPEAESIRTFVNIGYDISENVAFYAFANYSDSEADGSFFYRRPGVSQLAPLRLQDGSIYDPRTRYPGGFAPRFFGAVIDYSAAGGFEGEIAGLTYDLTGRFGHNEIDYTLANTLNPSLGPASPTEFKPGSLTTEEWAFNADFGYEIDTGGILASPLSFAFGTEYRNESYFIDEGDPLSYEVGPFGSSDPFNFNLSPGEVGTTVGGTAVTAGAGGACLIPGPLFDLTGECPAGDPIFTAAPIGSNGFPGFSPDFATDFSRSSYAFFADLEADITDQFLLNTAVRFEDFSDFGTTVNWKVAGRYEFFPDVALRGSVGTGFRAPTPGQISTVNVSTRIADSGEPVAEGIFPASDPVSLFFGSSPLKPEESFQFTTGLTFGLIEGLSFTVDYYNIELTDRIALSSDFALTDADVAALLLQGVDAGDIAQISYFTNGVDSTTQGVDVVATYDMDWGAAGATDFSVSMNWNKTELDRIGTTGGSPLINTEDAFDEENGLPSIRAVFSAKHGIGPFSLLGRLNYYGSYENGDSDLSDIQEFGPEVLVDVELTYELNETFSFSIGGQNIFDNFPDVADSAVGDTCCGRIYRSDSVVSWQGGFWYLRANANF